MHAPVSYLKEEINKFSANQLEFLTLLRPLTDARSKANFAIKKAFPPSAERKLKPIGTKIMRNNEIPISIIEIPC